MVAPVVLDVRVVSGSGGGPDKTILNSPRYFADAGYRMLCAYLHHPEDPGVDQLRARAEQYGAPFLSVADRGPLDWSVLPSLLDICRRECVAVWHGHDYKSNLLGLVLRRLWPMRLVTTVHGWVHFTPRTAIYYRIDRACLRRYDLVLCVSTDLYNSCRAMGVPEARCALVENGIDTAQFSRRHSIHEARERLGATSSRLVIGAAGRLSPEKGFELLIRAADRVLASGIDFELWIAGEGEQRLFLERLIKDLRREDRIRMLGYQSDTRPFYEALDGFVLSSFREGLPNVLLEAMAMGVPVIASRIGGVPQLVSHEHNGLLVDSDDRGALSGALRCLLKDPGRRHRLREAGRQTVNARFSFATRIQRIGKLYDDLLRGPCGAVARKAS